MGKINLDFLNIWEFCIKGFLVENPKGDWKHTLKKFRKEFHANEIFFGRNMCMVI